MSKQTSLITFTGKMGGISFYQRNGVHVARKAGGPDRSRIMNHPKFERTRENISEFGGLSLSISLLTRMIAPVKNLRDNKLRGRVCKIFRAIMKLDESIRGQREIRISQHREDVLGLELNDECSLKTAFGAKYTATHSADRRTATIRINDLHVNTMILAPLGTTHFQLVQLVGVLPDTVYNAQAKRYEPAGGTLYTINDVTFSDYISVGSHEPLSRTLETTLDVASLTDEVTVIQGLGILFFTRNGTAYYPSQQNKGMSIVGAY